MWANTVAAYETLPPVLRGVADQLWALHANAYDYGVRLGRRDTHSRNKRTAS